MRGGPLTWIDSDGLRSCKHVFLKAVLSCYFRKKGHKDIFKKKVSKPDKYNYQDCPEICKGVEPKLVCDFHVNATTISKGYNRAETRIRDMTVKGNCGFVGALIKQIIQGAMDSAAFDIIISFIGGSQGEKKEGWYIDCAGTADLYVSLFECPDPRSICESTKIPATEIIMRGTPGTLHRGGSSPIWH